VKKIEEFLRMMGRALFLIIPELMKIGVCLNMKFQNIPKASIIKFKKGLFLE
jgi:hypothetical protein